MSKEFVLFGIKSKKPFFDPSFRILIFVGLEIFINPCTIGAASRQSARKKLPI